MARWPSQGPGRAACGYGISIEQEGAMNDEHLTNQPVPAPPATRPTGFRPPARKQRAWTPEATQAVVTVGVFSTVGLTFASVMSVPAGLPWALLGPALGLIIGASVGSIAAWSNYVGQQPKGTRVWGGELPGPQAQPKTSAKKPGQPALPP